MPATSENLTFGRSSAVFFAFVLPNCICLLLAPCIWLMKNQNTPTMITSGRSVVSSVIQMLPELTLTSNFVSGCSSMRALSDSSPTYVEWKLVVLLLSALFLNVPSTAPVLALYFTSTARSSLTVCTNSLVGIWYTSGWRTFVNW